MRCLMMSGAVKRRIGDFRRVLPHSGRALFSCSGDVSRIWYLPPQLYCWGIPLPVGRVAGLGGADAIRLALDLIAPEVIIAAVLPAGGTPGLGKDGLTLHRQNQQLQFSRPQMTPTSLRLYRTIPGFGH